ncbi:putative RING-H2 finger protein ATL19, partial [Cucurbita argyrosperma subsp. sororia]
MIPPPLNPPPSILPFLTSFSIIILIFVSIIIFSVLASFAIIVLVYFICKYLVHPTYLDEHDPVLVADERNQNQSQSTRTRILVSHPTRHGGDVENASWREGLERKGLREQALKKTTTVLVSYGSSEATAKFVDCAICLEDFEKGELCQIFPVCNHIFHYCCIQRWLKKNMTCPICRCSIE